MTIVIATHNYMLSDSLVSDNTTTQKLFRVRGDVIGIAGALMNARRFLRWWEDRRRKKPNKDEEFDALIWRPGKGLFYCDQNLDPIKLELDVFAIGTGSDYALGAYRVMQRLDVGDELDKLEIAVEVACQEVVDCGGDIQRELLR